MPSTHTDKFYLIDPYSPPPAGTALTAVYLNYVDQNDDGVLSTPTGDSINGQDITNVWHGDTVTVNINGTIVTYTGTTFYTAGGGKYFTPINGTNLQNATFVSSTYVNTSTSVTVNELGTPCFVPGTLIETQTGPCPVEALSVGDLVRTLDHGLQPVRWIGRSVTEASGKHAPVMFRAGAIGNEKELRVSPQHRILVRGWQAELYYGAEEVLVPAKHLINGRDITQRPSQSVEYMHILFDQHELIWSDGILSESFYPGDFMLLSNRAVQAEVLELFPELEKRGDGPLAKLARPALKKREALLLKHAA